MEKGGLEGGTCAPLPRSPAPALSPSFVQGSIESRHFLKFLFSPCPSLSPPPQVATLVLKSPIAPAGGGGLRFGVNVGDVTVSPRRQLGTHVHVKKNENLVKGFFQKSNHFLRFDQGSSFKETDPKMQYPPPLCLKL